MSILRDFARTDRDQILDRPPRRRRSSRNHLPWAVAAAVMLALALAWVLWPEPEVGEPIATELPAVPQAPAPKQMLVGESKATPAAAPEPTPAPSPRTPHRIAAGQTLIGVLDGAGVSPEQARAAIQALKQVFDPRSLKVGQELGLVLDQEAGAVSLRELALRPDIDREVVVWREGGGFRSGVRQVPHERRLLARSFAIEGSLYASAAEVGVPQEAMLEAYRQLSHELDFERDLRRGDRVTLVFEQFYHPDDGSEHPGGLVYIELERGERDLVIYRFDTDDGIVSFFEPGGASIETRFARTPVRGGTLTSIYGRRRHPLLGRTRMHRGWDFSAPHGAEIVAVADGVVERASRWGGFGNYIRIKHEGGLATAYAHLSHYADGLKAGQRVKAGQVIGYVGDSGLATSPSLHYEVLRQGKQIDPRSLELPPRLTLAGAELQRFRAWQQQIAAAVQLTR